MRENPKGHAQMKPTNKRLATALRDLHDERVLQVHAAIDHGATIDDPEISSALDVAEAALHVAADLDRESAITGCA